MMFILIWVPRHHRPSISWKVSPVTNLKILFESHSAGTKDISYFWMWAKMRKNGGSHGVAWPFTGHQSMVLWLSESRLRESIDCWWHRRRCGERWWGSNRGWQHGSMATPRVSSQCATFGPSLSRRSGMEPHAAEYLPAPPSPPSPSCHTAITFVSEMCGNGGARPRVGPPAKWAREARRPDGLERCL